MISVFVNEREASVITHGPITAGSVGVPVEFEFSEGWDGLVRVAIFRTYVGGEQYEAVPVNGRCTVPHEVLATAAGQELQIGVFGANVSGTVIVPTVWCNAGYVYEGAIASGVDPEDPTESWIEQLQEIVITDGSVTTTKLATHAVTSEKIDSAAVTVSKIADGSVTKAKIAAGAVGDEELAEEVTLQLLPHWTGTQEQYDALQSYDADTTYYIVEASS